MRKCIHLVLFSFCALLLGSCSSNASSDDGGTMQPCGAGCPANQACVSGLCMGLPAHCPCPLGSYCNLATDSCIAGCTDTTQCETPQICNTVTRQCLSGCTSDTDCGGLICNVATLKCVPVWTGFNTATT